MKHTKGNWTLEDGQITSPENVAIGMVYGADDFPCIDPDDHDMNQIIEECRANGHLLIAAPELLEALEGVLLDWHDGTIPLVYRGKPGSFDVARIRIARAKAAIAKARGITVQN